MTEKIKIEMTLDELADIQHQIWSSWMEWLFKCGTFVTNFDDTSRSGFLITQDKVNRWLKQLNTNYKDLSDQEKESDRKVVREFLLKEVIK